MVWDLLTGHQSVPCPRCGAAMDGPADLCEGCDRAEQASWARHDPEVGWGFAEPVCAHGQPVSAYCRTCETECVHGAYGPGCPDCAAGRP
jgi:hypothetical protein